VIDAGDRVATEATWFRSTESGNIFVAESAPVDVLWVDAKRLRLTYDASVRSFLLEKERSGVTVEYVPPLPNKPLQPASGSSF
jgi:hypothetical protein